MDYVEVIFDVQPKSTGTEILIALLPQIGYEGFEESEEGLKAYILRNQFDLNELNRLPIFHSIEFTISYSHKVLQNQNWNEVWESNFDPVLIAEKVHVRAPFHKTNRAAKYEIIIEPKMSFGTAHHETTSMMMELMLEENFSNRSVVDMGCGTGILSILAQMLGAKSILAIDNDEWAFSNAIENVRKNNCRKINVVMGNAGSLQTELYDFILANINRNILLEDMSIYANHLVSGGIILLSGFYFIDLETIVESADSFGLKLDHTITKNDWIAARFIKLN
jgi:ribosomal protein L11 methyltransferase